MTFHRLTSRLHRARRWTPFQAFLSAGSTLLVCLFLAVVSPNWQSLTQRIIISIYIVLMAFLAGIQFYIGIVLREHRRNRARYIQESEMWKETRHAYFS